MIAAKCLVCGRPRVRLGRKLCQECLDERRRQLARKAEADERTALLLSRPGSAVIKGDVP